MPRLFVTGASGYIGLVVVEHAVRAGHTVEGLARSADGAAKVAKLGATPLLGDLKDLELLQAAAARADVVVHLAYTHDFTLPYDTVIAIEVNAVTALARGAAGRPIITSSGTALVAPAADGGWTDEASALCAPGSHALTRRSEAERAVLALRGAHVVAVRLPPYVYGRGGSYFAPALMQLAAKHGVAAWVAGEPSRAKHTSAVDVDDAARLYLALVARAKSVPAGSVYNCTADWPSTQQLAEAVGRAVGVPARGVSRAEAEALWGPFMAAFVDFENRASSAKAARELEWRPEAPLGLCDDITRGSYAQLAATLRAKGAAEAK